MIANEAFCNNASYIHIIDPRLRVSTAFLLSVGISLADHFMTLGLSLCFSLGLIPLARLPLWSVLKRLAAVIGFLICIWLMLPFTFEGKILWVIGPLNVYQPGIELSAQISLKSCSILILFLVLVSSMPVATLADVLYDFRLPKKFVFLLLITYRYLFVIHEEYVRLRLAMQIRGFTPGTNLHSLKTIAYLVGMLLVRASLRAERVNQAMILRGFKGELHSLEDFTHYRFPTGFILLIFCFSCLLIYFEWIL